MRNRTVDIMYLNIVHQHNIVLITGKPESSNSNGGMTMSLRDLYSQNSVYFLLGGLLPVFLIAVCVGVCVIWRKVKAYREDGKESNYRELRSTRYKIKHTCN